MKIYKTSSGNEIKLSKSEWQSIGKTAGWMKLATEESFIDSRGDEWVDDGQGIRYYWNPENRRVLDVNGKPLNTGIDTQTMHTEILTFSSLEDAQSFVDENVGRGIRVISL